jgi:ubiquinone/menaquinone biosynthesis C-methylase UbiE
MTEWAREYFEHGYAQRWPLDPPSEKTQREADALCAHLRLAPGARLLDVGCGHGKYAIAFAQRGVDVTGIDFAAPLLARARELATAAGATASWIRADMRSLPLRSASIQAGLLFDAFGFFETEEANASVLCELARVLAPNGRAALKVINAEPIIRNFLPTGREQRGDATVEIRRTLLSDPPRLVEDLEVTSRRGGRLYQRRQRLYDSGQLADQLEQAGFRTVQSMSSIASGEFDPSTSPTMVVIAERVSG